MQAEPARCAVNASSALPEPLKSSLETGVAVSEARALVPFKKADRLLARFP